VTVEQIPITGESDTTTVWGIVILLGVLAAIIFRRRRTHE
jgi:LPXTG-motif cell wall-anchored protein